MIIMMARTRTIESRSCLDVEHLPVISPKYWAFRQRFSDLVEATTQDLRRLAEKAFENKLISEDNLEKALNTTYTEGYRASRFISLILNKVKESDHHFDTFVDILEGVAVISKKIVSELRLFCGDWPKNCGQPEYQALENQENTLVPKKVDDTPFFSENGTIITFECRCGNKCTLESYVSAKCLGQLEKLYPYLDTEHMNDTDKGSLFRKLSLDVIRVTKNFENTLNSIFLSLSMKETLKLVEDNIIKTSVFTFGRKASPKPIQERHKKELSKIKTVRGIQQFLNRYEYVSFFNYRILEKIVEDCGTKNDKTKMKEYLKIFQEFCKCSVFKMPSSVIAKTKRVLKENLAVKVIENVWFNATDKSKSESLFTALNIYAIEDILAEVIGLHPTEILLLDIQKGCVDLSFMILSGAEHFPLTESQLQTLLSYGIHVIVQPNECDIGNSLPTSKELLHQTGVPPDKQLEQQLTSCVNSVEELQKQLEEEKQANKAEKEMLLRLVGGLEEKVNTLTQQQEEERQMLFRAIENQGEHLKNLTHLNQILLKKIERIEAQTQQHEEDAQTEAHEQSIAIESELGIKPQDDLHIPADDQGPTLRTLQLANPLCDDRQPDQPSLLHLQRINPLSDEPENKPPSLLRLSYNSLGDMSLDEHPSYAYLQQMNSMAEGEEEPQSMGFAYLNFINPISEY